VGYLTRAEVQAYLAQQGPSEAATAELAAWVHRRTEGHPLFMVHVVEELARHGRPTLPTAAEATGPPAEADAEVPAGLEPLIELQLGRLGAEAQQVLEVASVVGAEFAEASVAAGVSLPLDAIAAICDGLARQGQFLEDLGLAEWPDGTVSGRFGFRHALYRAVLYRRLGSGRRVRVHRTIGARLETAYGAQASQLAAALAVHFERGHDPERAVPYLGQAAEQALRRYAYQEASCHLQRGLALLQTLPDTPARAQQELDLQLALGRAFIASKGSAAPEVQQTYARARALCAQVGDTPEIFPAQQGLWQFYLTRGALQTARELGEQLDRLAQREAAPTLRLVAHGALGITLFYLGEYAVARTYLEQGMALTDPTTQRDLLRHHLAAPGVRCLAVAANVLWCLGYPAQAVQRGQEALTLAQQLADPYSLGLAQHWTATLHYRRREAPMVQAQAHALLSLATAQGFPLLVGYGTCWRGWALALQGESAAGLAQLRQGMAAVMAMGQEQVRPLALLLLAEAAGHGGQVEDGLRLLAESRAALEANGQGDLLAEASRLQGVLLLQQAVPDPAQAEACFQEALTMARRQEARSWELRAALSLGRLWQRQGKGGEARALLAPVYGWFTEGFDTADLQDAKALLAELAEASAAVSVER
jgi:predicted ATPase